MLTCRSVGKPDWQAFFKNLGLLPATEFALVRSSPVETHEEPVPADATPKEPASAGESKTVGALPTPELTETELMTLQEVRARDDERPVRKWWPFRALVSLAALAGTAIYAHDQHADAGSARTQLQTAEKGRGDAEKERDEVRSELAASVARHEHERTRILSELAKWEFLNDFEALPLSSPLPTGPNLGIDFGAFRTLTGKKEPPTPVQYMCRATGPIPAQKIQFRIASSQAWRATVLIAKGGSDPRAVTAPNSQKHRWIDGDSTTSLDLPACALGDVVFIVVSVRDDKAPIPTEPVPVSIGRVKDN